MPGWLSWWVCGKCGGEWKREVYYTNACGRQQQAEVLAWKHHRHPPAPRALIPLLYPPPPFRLPCTSLRRAGSQEREYEVMLQQLLEGVLLTAHHPRTSILVVVQVGLIVTLCVGRCVCF